LNINDQYPQKEKSKRVRTNFDVIIDDNDKHEQKQYSPMSQTDLELYFMIMISIQKARISQYSN
jgi:hypothetical protein